MQTWKIFALCQYKCAEKFVETSLNKKNHFELFQKRIHERKYPREYRAGLQQQCTLQYIVTYIYTQQINRYTLYATWLLFIYCQLFLKL